MSTFNDRFGVHNTKALEHALAAVREMRDIVAWAVAHPHRPARVLSKVMTCENILSSRLGVPNDRLEFMLSWADRPEDPPVVRSGGEGAP